MSAAGILLALLSAMVWGSGDFSGGLAARRSGEFQVLMLSSLSGVVLLIALAIFSREHLPPIGSLSWAGLAGFAGALGIAALYRGLSFGQAAAVAPTAAVLTAALPVVFGAFVEGLPRAPQLGGFVLAGTGIWLVARASTHAPASRAGLKLAVLAGVGFGAFLIFIAQVQRDLVFGPLAVARCVTLATAVGIILVRRQSIPSLGSNPIALVAGVLDAGGNILYMLARQYTRLDVAAVLSSLYPVATVVLARVVLAEPVSGAQWAGAGVCLIAVVLITI